MLASSHWRKKFPRREKVGKPSLLVQMRRNPELRWGGPGGVEKFISFQASDKEAIGHVVSPSDLKGREGSAETQ